MKRQNINIRAKIEYIFGRVKNRENDVVTMISNIIFSTNPQFLNYKNFKAYKGEKFYT